MKFFDLQVAKAGAHEPNDIFRLPDPDHWWTSFLADPFGQLERGQEACRLGGANAGGLLKLGTGASGEAAERAGHRRKQLRRDLQGRLMTGTGPQENRQQLYRGQRSSAERPEALARAICIGKSIKRNRHPRTYVVMPVGW